MKVLFKNVVDLKAKHKIFKNPDLSFSVSSRLVDNKTDIIRYLQLLYIYIDISQISTVFGSTTDPSDFYGGRVYNPLRSLSEQQVNTLKNKNINLALTLTNHFFSKELYSKNLLFLEKYHQKGNVIICTSDELAKMIKKDFPLYLIRASIIKNLNKIESIKKAFDLYEDVVIPMDMNDDNEFLESLPYKDRIILFANAACAYTCPTRICYAVMSKINQSKTTKCNCTKEKLGMLENAVYFFDVEKFHQMGYSNFKLIPAYLSRYKDQTISK